MGIISFLVVISFYALPIAAVIWFLVSLVGYLQAKPQRTLQPDRFMAWRRSLIASAIVAGVLLALFVGILVLLAAAVAYM